MDEKTTGLYFTLFNEIGIINQLSSAVLAAHLPGGLAVSHFSVLNHLIRVKDGQTPLALASAFQVPKTTMTHTLGGLRAHALIEMRPNPDDGRSKRIWITGEGRRFREEAIAGLADAMRPFALAFPPETVADLVPRLAEIRAYLDKARD